jgi:hypothetical protein
VLLTGIELRFLSIPDHNPVTILTQFSRLPIMMVIMMMIVVMIISNLLKCKILVETDSGRCRSSLPLDIM